jgi:hypothetical protein
LKGDKIYYKEGYKYQLTRSYALQTLIYPPREITHDFFIFREDGTLFVAKGYAWDGASGPTWDTKSSMRPSLIHDCFCQMAKERELDYKTYAPLYNQLFHDMCVEDNMFKARAALWQAGVIIGRGGDPEIPDDNPEQSAP